MSAHEIEIAQLRAHAKNLAGALADAAGYLASVRTDVGRRVRRSGRTYALQTLEWGEGAKEIAEKANALLEAHDDLYL